MGGGFPNYLIDRFPHIRRRALDQISCLAIDDEILLLDSYGEGGTFHHLAT
jgi:hypothetical protein